ncbi:MAG: substrate-binding domain-containing protein [Corynebacterium sp.]|uniref:substrate-binding domain-containing protein n=1 Tax=Corynebacterium sp. TaxID=1720 RepID=UPI0026DCEF94|nr:substrate-binding domain-containing protein [Corynebacterium sp.]MDO5097178.1 substrate-binding domain-containing protein [Corynebacterium sp.]
MLSLSFVTGTEPDKWCGRFTERTRHGGLAATSSDDPLALVIADTADLGLVRLPDARVDSSMHVVTLYDEQLGVALNKDHTLTLLETLTETDITDDIIHYRLPATGLLTGETIAEIRTHLQVVAAGVGIVIAPRPLLKNLSGNLVEHREYVDPEITATTIALVWRKEKDNDAIQDFVGIAKGRTANSSRQAQPKKTAREKALAKKARAAARSGKTANATGKTTSGKPRRGGVDKQKPKKRRGNGRS